MQDQEGAPEEGEEEDVMQEYSCAGVGLQEYFKEVANSKDA